LTVYCVAREIESGEGQSRELQGILRLTVNENGSMRFGKDNEVKAILGQILALLVRPAFGRGADRRVAGQSMVCSVAVGPLCRVRESGRRLRRLRPLRHLHCLLRIRRIRR
jgi:hypothetical protein